MKRSILIEPAQQKAFTRRLEKLNKKGLGFGLSEIKIVATREVLYERKLRPAGRHGEVILSSLVPAKPEESPAAPVILLQITIEYPIVKLGSWSIIGKLDAHAEGNLVYALHAGEQEAAALARFANAPLRCEHCNANRKRTSSFVLKDDASGDYKEVGSTCLEDFTGIDPAAALFLAKMDSSVRVVEGEFEALGANANRTQGVSTRYFLAAVNWICQTSGYVSNARSEESSVIPTWDDALGLLMNQERKMPDMEPHLQFADKLREWFANKEGAGMSLFDRNVKLLVGSDTLPLKRQPLSFAAGAVPYYWGATKGDETGGAKKVSQHVGEVGQKMQSDLSIMRVVPIDTRFGVVSLVLLRDSEGNSLVWKTKALPGHLYNQVHDGARVDIKAVFKVKEHGEYNGTKQTSVTHLKILD